MVNLDSMLESSSMMIFKLKSEEDPGQSLQDPEDLHYQQIALGWEVSSDQWKGSPGASGTPRGP